MYSLALSPRLSALLFLLFLFFLLLPPADRSWFDPAPASTYSQSYVRGVFYDRDRRNQPCVTCPNCSNVVPLEPHVMQRIRASMADETRAQRAANQEDAAVAAVEASHLPTATTEEGSSVVDQTALADRLPEDERKEGSAHDADGTTVTTSFSASVAPPPPSTTSATPPRPQRQLNFLGDGAAATPMSRAESKPSPASPSESRATPDPTRPTLQVPQPIHPSATRLDRASRSRTPSSESTTSSPRVRALPTLTIRTDALNQPRPPADAAAFVTSDRDLPLTLQLPGLLTPSPSPDRLNKLASRWDGQLQCANCKHAFDFLHIGD